VARGGERSLVSARDGWEGRLEDTAERPPGLAPEQEPPATAGGRESEWTSDHHPGSRDMRPALGSRGGPASWTPEDAGAPVALARPDFGDARWSFLYTLRDTAYASVDPDPGEVAAANRRMRAVPVPEVQGPFIKPPVWTWEVPLYFWTGGLASGAAFVAMACDVAGDPRSAAIARKVSLGAVTAAPLLLIGDLGRPERFLNMLRIVKPRSPMSMGAWCLVGFSGAAAAAVGADLLDRPRMARALGAAASLLGGYLGSYTGVLLASTAVPVWARSRLFLGPIFVCTATATGAAATRLAVVARGLPPRHPTRRALGTVETASILTELALTAVNHRRLGPAGEALRRGRPGLLLRAAEAAVVAGLATRLAGHRTGHRLLHDLASLLYLAGGLGFRMAWVESGRASATDHDAAAAMGRQRTVGGPHVPGLERRAPSTQRAPLPLPGLRRAWAEAVRRTSLAVERTLSRRHLRSPAG
jgi:Polysulphide reductase, NrfD